MSRYFFALNPEDKIRKKIVLSRSKLSCYGRWVNTENIHLTLLFLGDLTQEQLQKVVCEAKKIIFSEFEMNLNETGFFKKSQIAWLGLNTIPEPLLILNRCLLDAAKQSNIAISQQTYKPHVTLSRKSEKLNKIAIESIKWKVIEFVLLKSIDTREGVKYQSIESFKVSHNY